MIALVTGATGFVGSHVAETLLARGDRVRCLVRKPDRARRLAERGATLVEGSLEDERAIAAALQGVNVVYHVAGLTAARSEAEFFAVNEHATRRLLQHCDSAARLTRFVYVSTQAAVGPSGPGERTPEDAPCAPLTSYGRSKLAGERAVRESAVGWVIARPPVVYGPRDVNFLPLFRLVRLGLNPVFGRGTQLLSIVFAPDLAEGIVLAGTRGSPGEIYHLANPDPVTYRDIGRAAGRALGRKPVTLPLPEPLAGAVIWSMENLARLGGKASVVSVDRMAEFRAPAWVLSVEKAERELGWRASHDLDAGVKKTAEWYRGAGWLA